MELQKPAPAPPHANERHSGYMRSVNNDAPHTHIAQVLQPSNVRQVALKERSETTRKPGRKEYGCAASREPYRAQNEDGRLWNGGGERPIPAGLSDGARDAGAWKDSGGFGGSASNGSGGGDGGGDDDTPVSYFSLSSSSSAQKGKDKDHDEDRQIEPYLPDYYARETERRAARWASLEAHAEILTSLDPYSVKIWLDCFIRFDDEARQRSQTLYHLGKLLDCCRARDKKWRTEFIEEKGGRALRGMLSNLQGEYYKTAKDLQCVGVIGQCLEVLGDGLDV